MAWPASISHLLEREADLFLTSAIDVGKIPLEKYMYCGPSSPNSSRMASPLSASTYNSRSRPDDSMDSSYSRSLNISAPYSPISMVPLDVDDNSREREDVLPRSDVESHASPLRPYSAPSPPSASYYNDIYADREEAPGRDRGQRSQKISVSPSAGRGRVEFSEYHKPVSNRPRSTMSGTKSAYASRAASTQPRSTKGKIRGSQEATRPVRTVHAVYSAMALVSLLSLFLSLQLTSCHYRNHEVGHQLLQRRGLLRRRPPAAKFPNSLTPSGRRS